jgi:sugar phosphate permease
MALPYIKEEFNLSNKEAGLLISFFFTFYAIGQIPCGFLYRKITVRVMLPLAMILTSLCTWMIGHANSIFILKIFQRGFRSGGSLSVSAAELTINSWFPAREKGTAMVYFSAMKCGPVIVPPSGFNYCCRAGALFWSVLFRIPHCPGLVVFYS